MVPQLMTFLLLIACLSYCSEVLLFPRSSKLYNHSYFYLHVELLQSAVYHAYAAQAGRSHTYRPLLYTAATGGRSDRVCANLAAPT